MFGDFLRELSAKKPRLGQQLSWLTIFVVFLSPRPR